MPTLSEILEALLDSIARAQDRSNQMSARIAHKYRDNKVLRNFPVPNGLLNELDLELVFGIEDVVREPSAGRAAAEPAVQVFRRAARGFAAEAFRALRGALEEPESQSRERRRRIVESLASKRTADDVGERLAADLHSRRWNFLEATGGLDREAARRVVVESLAEHLLGDPNLAGELEAAGVDGRALLEGVPRAAGDAARAMAELEGASRALDLDQEEEQVQVIVDTRRLEDLPAHLLNKLKVKAGLRDYRWQILEEDVEEILLED